MKKLKIISVLLLTLTLNSIAANAAVTTTKNKDGSVTITDTTTGNVTEISNDDDSPVTDEQIAEGIADNANPNATTDSSDTTSSDDGVQIKKVENGWTQDNNGYWYYFKDSVMQTGWLQLGSDWYYLESNGMMATNQWIGNAVAWKSRAQGYYVGWNGKYIENATQDDEHEPVYNQITLEQPNGNKYYRWGAGSEKFKYNSRSHTWEGENVTVGTTQMKIIAAGIDTDRDAFNKYAIPYLKPTGEGTDGEERKVIVWIYLGDKW